MDTIAVGDHVYIGRGEVKYLVLTDNQDGTHQIRSVNALNVSLTKDVATERLSTTPWWER